MRIGLSVASEIGGLRGPALLAAIDERVAAAAGAGLDALHIGDKHGQAVPYAANVALAGRLTSVWDGRLGLLAVSTMWNPVLLAEQIATIAAMTPTLDVVMALGDGDAHFASVGVAREGALSRYLDGWEVVRALVGGETVTADVGEHHVRDAQVPMAVECEVSWWMAASVPTGIRRAAAMADGWLASAKLSPDDARRAVEIYRRAGGGRPVLRRDCFVGASSDHAETVARPVIRAGHRGYPSDALVVGDADAVAGQFERFDDAGYDELLIRSLVNDDQAEAIGSIGRLADVRDRLGPPTS